MRNPFDGCPSPIIRRQMLLGREEAFKDLEEMLRKNLNAVIMGPEGVGKSSFLNCFFNKEGRHRLAQEEGILTVKVDFPVHLKEDEVYPYLTCKIEAAVDALNDIDPATSARIRSKLASAKDDQTDDARLQLICQSINDEEYRVVLVIDDFENFTSSQSINMAHHSFMRSLKNHGVLYVVATNYDLAKDTLPAQVSGSFLMQLFSGNEITLTGFSEAVCHLYLDAAGRPMYFSDAEVKRIRWMSGGIPALLRLTAEAAWDQKQETPVLDDAAWEKIQDRLYYDETVRRYMTHWCRSFTSKRIEVINSLLDLEKNPNGVVTDDWITFAESLRMRGILIPYVRDGREVKGCYRFNSVLLMDYCFNNTLSESDPHDVQKGNIVQQLQQMIEEGKKGEVLDLLRSVCSSMENVTMPVDFVAPLTQEELQQFELHTEVMRNFAPEVQDLLETGIRTEHTFLQVEMKDYAPVYISFAKAIEAHLNKKLVPLLKEIAPTHSLKDGPMLRNYSGMLMLGALSTILSAQFSQTQTTFCRNAAQYCAARNCGQFDEAWWEKLKRDMQQIKTLRNGMPHTTPLSGESGKELLKLLFSGSDAFMLRCSDLSDAVTKASVEPRPNTAAPSAPPANPALYEGAVVTGTVVGLIPHAAFVDIGANRDAFLRISDISDSYIADINDVLTRGQQIRVKIERIDPFTGKIDLIMRGVPQN